MGIFAPKKLPTNLPFSKLRSGTSQYEQPVIQFRSASSGIGVTQSSGSVDAGKPINFNNNDLLIASLLINGSKTVPPPAGWAKICDVEGLGAYHVFWALGSVATTQFNSIGGGGSGCLVSIMAFIGVDPLNPIAEFSTNYSLSTTVNIPTVSTKKGYGVLALFSDQAVTTEFAAKPAGFTDIVSIVDIADSMRTTTSYKGMNVDGSTGTLSRFFNSSTFFSKFGMALVLNPATNTNSKNINVSQSVNRSSTF